MEVKSGREKRVRRLGLSWEVCWTGGLEQIFPLLSTATELRSDIQGDPKKWDTLFDSWHYEKSQLIYINFFNMVWKNAKVINEKGSLTD